MLDNATDPLNMSQLEKEEKHIILYKKGRWTRELIGYTVREVEESFGTEESGRRESLGEYIRWVGSAGNRSDQNVTSGMAIPAVVVSDINMLGALVDESRIHQGTGRRIVHMNRDW